MEQAKTINDLLNAAPLDDANTLAVNQQQVFNPITQQNGDTRRVSLSVLKEYIVNSTGLIGEQILTEAAQYTDQRIENALTEAAQYTDQRFAFIPFIAASSPFLVTSDRRKLTIKAGTKIGTVYLQQDFELNVATLLDTGAITNGKDYYVFISQNIEPITILISLIKNPPQNFIRIGSFHTLCVGVGSNLTYQEGGVTKNHLLSGFVAGDILPHSISCINFRPYSEAEGMVFIPPKDIWCDIYLPSGSGANTKSVYQGAITRSRQYGDFVEDMFCVNKELLDDGEFAAAMLGSNEQTAVSGESEAGATNGGAGGRVDTTGRRMISIYGVEEGCGSLWQWLRTTSAAGMQGEIYQQTTENPIAYGNVQMSFANAGPFPQAGGKGKFWGIAGALLAGGAWNNGAGCGSRARNAITARSNASSYNGGRGRSRCIRGNSLLSV